MSLGALDKGALQQAWTTFQSLISDEERKHFETYACNGLDEYITTLVSACKAHRNTHLRVRILGWFEPIYQVVQRLVPVAAIAIQAYPTPGSLVLGSIVGVLQIAERLYEYQAKTMQFLTQMSSKLQTILTYENDLYEDNEFVGRALILVFGDILTFCNRAFKFMTHKGSLHARVKGFRWMTFKDFEKQLGEIVTGFDSHMGELEARALECDKQRLKEIRTMLEVHQNKSKQIEDRQNQKTDRLEELSRQILRKQTELDDGQITKEKEKLRVRALNWLSPLTFTDAYLRITEKHLEGTGAWLLESPTYQSWKHDQEPKILCVKGKPGCGKSFLAARVNLDLSLGIEPGVSVAYAFFQRADQNVQTQRATLGALAKQIIIQKQKSEPMLIEEYSSEHRSETVSEKFIWQILEHVTAESTVTYIVIDALDEHKDGDEFARCLVHMANHFRNTKIIVFSRDDIRFEEVFTGCARLRPDHGENEKDLRAYLDAVFDDPDDMIPLSQDIRNQCVEKAQGVILWIRLFRESLRNPILRHKRLKKIGEMQPGLEAMYDDLLLTLGFGERYIREQAWLILLLILYAKTPMTAAEMLEAIVDLEDVRNLATLREERYPNGDYLTSICANLIFVDREGFVRLFHESVRNHLEFRGTAREASWMIEYKNFCHDPHQKYAEICLKYLMLEDFDYGGAQSSAQLSIRLKKAPFLKYAATSWAWHYKQADSSSGALFNLLRRLVESAPRRELCLQLHFNDTGMVQSHSLPLCLGKTNILQILAVEGLHLEAELLLDNANAAQLLLEHGTVFGIHILAVCSAFGYREMLLWLLSLNSPCDIGNKELALILATCNGHVDIARHLIDHGISVHIKDYEERGLLVLAARNNQTAMVSLLLDKNIDTVSYDENGWTALHHAASIGNLEMVEALCKAGADSTENKRDANAATPLHIAAIWNAAACIKAMFEFNAQLNINAIDICGNTALHKAARWDACAAAMTLIELGCRKDIANLDGQTPLFLAADSGHIKTAQLLIDKGVDIRLQTNWGETALHAAANNGKMGLLQTLIRQRPTTEWAELLNLAQSDGETVVHATIKGGNVENLKFAISAGGNGDAKAVENWSLLHYVSHFGSEDMIQPILKASPDPNPRNEVGRTPLHIAAKSNKVEFMQRLFRECDKEGLQLDIDVLDDYGSSPLMIALHFGQLQAADLLLKEGAVCIAEKDGSYPIHIAAENGYVELVKILLNHPGVDCKDAEDKLPLHCAAISGKVNLIQLFIGYFAQQLNAQDKYGFTPIMLALQHEHIEAANYLMDHNADVTPVSYYGENISPYISKQGDLSLLRRAISMGCDANMQDKFGETALMRAIEYSNIDVLDELLRAYPESWTVPDFVGKMCQHFAAAKGNLELLIQLQQRGADLKRRNDFNRSPLYYGVNSGHLPVVKYLYSQGCPIDEIDNSGWTTLMTAIESGYLTTVTYLLEHYTPDGINRVHRYSYRTAMAIAAMKGFGILYDMMKEAGGDPFQRDAMGLSNEYYRTCVSRYELDTKAIDVVDRYSRNSIQRCCSMLKHVTEASGAELESHLDLLCVLTDAFRYQSDYGLAGLCLMERRWSHELAQVHDVINCDICHSRRFNGDMYVCTSCLSEVIICKDCHENYMKEGRRGPRALEELRFIEEKMRTIRVAIPGCFGVEEITQAAYYFGPNGWLDSMNKSYESWGLDHNANNAYGALAQPGREFVEILLSAQELRKQVSAVDTFLRDSAHSESWLKICKRFEGLNQEHPVGKLLANFRCSGHPFFLVSKEDRDRLVAEGVKLDSEYGRMTDVAYEEIRAEYSNNHDVEANEETLALLELPPILTHESEQRNEEAPSSPQMEVKVQLTEFLNQLTSDLDKVTKEMTEIATTVPQMQKLDVSDAAKQEDNNLIDKSSTVKTSHLQNKLSSYSQAVDPATMQRLREAYLELYPTAAPDNELWVWAVAVQIAEIASPGFQEIFVEERLAAMAEKDYEMNSWTM